MKYKIQYFQPKEFVCKCCGGGMVVTRLVYSLDILRRAWDAPIKVNSGYRCERHNKEVGGSPISRHLLGLAADIAPVNPELIGPFQTLVGYLFGRREGWELKFYPSFVHLAVPREEKSLWCGGLWCGGLINVSVTNATPAASDIM